MRSVNNLQEIFKYVMALPEQSVFYDLFAFLSWPVSLQQKGLIAPSIFFGRNPGLPLFLRDHNETVLTLPSPSYSHRCLHHLSFFCEAPLSSLLLSQIPFLLQRCRLEIASPSSHRFPGSYPPPLLLCWVTFLMLLLCVPHYLSK